MEDPMATMLGSPASEALTPRSKVAKMLADIDDEIDSAPTPSPTRVSTPEAASPNDNSHAVEVATTPDKSDLAPVPQVASSASGNAHPQPASASDGSDDSVRRPQGRAARRMFILNRAMSRKSSSPLIARSPIPEKPVMSETDEDELYSAFPKQRLSRRQPTASPTLSGKGTGLFVSPSKSVDPDSDDELPTDIFGGRDKLVELVAQKRAERLAKEAKEKQHRNDASGANLSSDLPDEVFEGSGELVDPNIERIMSDATRPSRKASKRALLEMERETQRMARQQALAHQMKIKKKFTTNDLFAKFNFRQPQAVKHPQADTTMDAETSASSAPNSDGVEEKSKETASTPPSSPPTPLDRQKALVEQGALSKLMPVRQDSLASMAEFDDDEELPEMKDVLASSRMKHRDAEPPSEAVQSAKKGLKLARLGKKAVTNQDSSDDELEIVDRLPPHLRAFERVAKAKPGLPSSDSKAIHLLKHLSNLYADDSRPQKKGGRPSVSAKVLEAQLRKHAKEQARQQQLERIEELRAKGIDVQTTEQREQEAEAFESLLEKARQDAVALRKAEKAARKEAGDEAGLQPSEDEDEDADYDYDGSESEDDGKNGQEHEEEALGADLFDEAADETTDDEVNSAASDVEEQEADEATKMDELEDNQKTVSKSMQTAPNALAMSSEGPRRPRKSRVVMDDDDEDPGHDPEPASAGPNDLEAAQDPFAAFNFGAGGDEDLLLSPTQAFHATMETPTQATQGDSFDTLRHIAPPSTISLPPSLPDFGTPLAQYSQVSIVAGSQVPESQRIELNWESRLPETPAAKLSRDVSGLSETPGWEPTQDPGLPSPWSAKLQRSQHPASVNEHETQSTVRMRISESPAASQVGPRRGRLTRRQAAVDDESDEENKPAASLSREKQNAFSEMARRRKEALTEAERAEANKEMRQMMDEQAEESEDEYAGLGGDDFVAPETEQDKEMIDSSHIEVDERAIAAHYAERERIRSEEETSRLYKDLTTGVLRRKMGANAFDLKEDEDELASRRRQMRQQEEARKRKALLKDVNIATLADGKQSKGKDAFLKAIADDDGDEDTGNVSDNEQNDALPTHDDSQPTQPQASTQGVLREVSGNKRRAVEVDDLSYERPPAKQRRIQGATFNRPTSLLEVQESVSFLLEGPNANFPADATALELSSDSEHDEAEFEDRANDSDDDLVAAEEARQNDGGFAPNPMSIEAKAMPPPRLPASQRRTAPKPTVVDRLSLKRVSSASESAHSRTAWAAGPTTGGFKVPSLLRRATTNSTSNANERGVSTPNLTREGSGVKMGGTKKSSLAYQARAEERRAIVEAGLRQREENTARIALLRRNSSALNRGLTGRFE